MLLLVAAALLSEPLPLCHQTILHFGPLCGRGAVFHHPSHLPPQLLPGGAIRQADEIICLHDARERQGNNKGLGPLWGCM